MDLLPGITQGITRVLVSYPFDSLKVHSQTNRKRAWDNFHNLLSNNPRALYRGVGLPMVTVSMERAIQYKYFERLKKTHGPFVAGAMTGAGLGIISTPMQAVTSNLVLLNKEQYGGFWDFLRKKWKTEGSKFFLRGYTVDLSRAILASTLYLGVYGTSRDSWLSQDMNPLLRTSICASLAGWTTWTVTFPLDTIRTLYQTSNSRNEAARSHTSLPGALLNSCEPGETTKRNNITLSQVVSSRFREAGLRSFWNGITPVLLRTFPSSVLGMIAYEKVRSKIDNPS